MVLRYVTQIICSEPFNRDRVRMPLGILSNFRRHTRMTPRLLTRPWAQTAPGAGEVATDRRRRMPWYTSHLGNIWSHLPSPSHLEPRSLAMPSTGQQFWRHRASSDSEYCLRMNIPVREVPVQTERTPSEYCNFICGSKHAIYLFRRASSTYGPLGIMSTLPTSTASSVTLSLTSGKSRPVP